MGHMENTKARLPVPYNQDLSQVLRGLDRRTPQAKARLANEVTTASYLAAGMRLLERNLGPNPERPKADPDDDNTLRRPLLELLSQRAVTAELANNPDPFNKQGSTSALRSTWRSSSDYIADLLRFGLWSRHYLGLYEDELAEQAERLVAGPDAIEAIHSVCYWGVRTRISTPTFRLQILATAAAEDDSVIRQALAEYYGELTANWQPVYEEFLRAHQLRLRPGITLDTMTYLLAGASEGIALRALADPQAPVIDEERKQSLFGTFALAFIAGCTERVGAAQGLTLEQAVQALAYGDSPANGSDESGEQEGSNPPDPEAPAA